MNIETMDSTSPTIKKYEKSNQADDKILYVVDKTHPAKPRNSPWETLNSQNLDAKTL